MKLLVISEFFLDDTNANAHCTRMLVQGLINCNVDVNVLCVRRPDMHEELSYQEKNISVNVQDDLDVGSTTIFDRAKRIALIPNWPLETPKTAKSIIKTACDLLKTEHYDGIVAVHKTYLSVYCALRIKKLYSDLTLDLYLLDPIANEIDKHLGIRRFLFPLVKLREREAYKKADQILNMRCNDMERINLRFANKIKYVDFPLLTNDEIKLLRASISPEPQKECIRFIYFGTINSIYRSPDYLIKLLLLTKKKEKIEAVFYCQGDCVSSMRKTVLDAGADFRIDGYLSQEKLSEEIKKSDIIINIGNAMSNMVPSKIFDLIKYGKPVLGISKQNNDKTDSYLERYGAALIIKESDNIDVSLQKLLSFIQQYRSGMLTPVEDVETYYKENTPEHTAKTIIKSLTI